MGCATLKPEDGALTLDDFRVAGADRRRELRTAVSKAVWLFMPAGEPRVGLLTDCSPHGVGILLKEPLREGDEFGLKLRLDRQRLVTYSVRYSRAEGARYKVGGLVSGVSGVEGHPDLEVIFRALLEAASPRR